MRLLIATSLILVNLTYARGQSSQQPEWLFKNLNLSRDSIPLDLVVSKQHPVRPELTIYCFPYITEYDCEGECWTGDIYVVLTKLDNSIVSLGKFTNGLTSDAISPRKIWIDTAPYNISKNARAFAIRIQSANNSRAASYSGEEFWLVIERTEKVECILRLDSEISMAYGGGNCENIEIHRQESIFVIDSEGHEEGYYPITERVKYQNYFLNEECEDGKKDIKRFENVFTYDGKEYKVKGERKTGW